MAPRKKPRKATAVANTPADSAAAATSTSASVVEKAPTNRTPARRNIRGRRGGLKDMPNMPLDILIEIFSCMHPRDLLSLARTSKEFRAFLMSRNAAPFWKAARQQVEGLPECPSFMSEPQYANLLFFTHCHNCLKPNSKMIIWELFVRYCQACRDKLIVRNVWIAYNLEDEMRQTLKMDGHVYTMVYMPRTKNSMYDVPYIHTLELEQLRAKWKSLTNDEEKKQFIQERVAIVKARSESVEAFKTWKAHETNNRSAELDAIKRERFESILERLREEEWGDELDLMDEFTRGDLRYHKAVRKAQKLTDAVWQSIRADVVAHMEGVRTARLEAVRHRMLCDRLKILYDVIAEYEASLGHKTIESECQAEFADLAAMPQFREIVEAPTDAEVTREDFERLRDTIPNLKTEWYEARKSEFLAKAREAIKEEDHPSPLSLAVITFDCRICPRTNLSWPTVLAHRCGREYTLCLDKYERAVAEVCSRKPSGFVWRGTDRTFSLSGRLDLARSVIAACGRDPDTATYEDMERSGARLVCMACPSELMGSYKEAFDWKQAVGCLFYLQGIAHSCIRLQVVHISNRVASDFGMLTSCADGAKWRLLDAKLAEEVRSVEQEMATKTPFGHLIGTILACMGPLYCCTRCRHRGRSSLILHCKNQHDVAEPQLGEDYYLHPDSLPRRSVRIFPEKYKTQGGALAFHVAADIMDGHGVIYSSTLFD
ncbi:hypothetical protein BV20DRAFT_988540 [Pilatotrama ljubarskyi]|nr:hypothetical protein BV20DRAFT_988540 [Pilatotrama ljubarskyi]